MERPAETDATALNDAPPAPPEPSPFARLRVSGLLGLFVLFSFVVAIGLLYVRPSHYKPGAGALMLMLAVMLALPVVIRGYQTKLSWRRVFGTSFQRRDLPLISGIVPVTILTGASAYLIYVPLSYLAPEFVRRMLLDDTVFDADTVGQWLLLALGGAVLIPIVEELLFRGIVMQRWAYRWGTRTGVIASSALFALGHGEWIGHFLFGMLMALLYLRTRRLWVPIVTHGLNNFLVMLPILWRIVSHGAPEPPETLTALRAEAWIGWPALAVGLLLGWIYLRALWPDGGLKAALGGPVPYEQHQTTTVQRGTE